MARRQYMPYSDIVKNIQLADKIANNELNIQDSTKINCKLILAFLVLGLEYLYLKVFVQRLMLQDIFND